MCYHCFLAVAFNGIFPLYGEVSTRYTVSNHYIMNMVRQARNWRRDMTGSTRNSKPDEAKDRDLAVWHREAPVEPGEFSNPDTSE